MIKHKEALYEIFAAKMVLGQSLYGNCDALMKTNISPLPSKVDKFITLSDFMTLPVQTGRMQAKYLVIMQDIICGGVAYENKIDGDVTAETWAYELARRVRTILRSNQSLQSASYPTGVARRTYIHDTPQEFVLYYDTSCCVHTIRLEIQIEEAD